MLRITHLAFAPAVAFLLLLVSAQAQTPRVTTINITAESERVHIASQGDVTEMRLEVVSEAGDIVFESGAITGDTLDWNMTDAQGERVAPGTYLVTVTFRNATGKLRKRVEQVTIAEDEKAATPAPVPNAVQAAVTTSSAGTDGKIAKFTGAATIADSIIVESAGKIGIGTAAPPSPLTVVGTGGGIPAISGGNNSADGIGVKGTSSHATGIGLLGLHTGTGGTTPGVKGETSSTAAQAVGVLGVVNPTNAGDGSAAVRGTNNGTGVNGIGVRGEHAGDGFGVYGTALGGYGVYGRSDGVAGLYGLSTNGYGAFGQSTAGSGVEGLSFYGDGVRGTSVNGYAGSFQGNAKVTGNVDFGSITRQMLNLYARTYAIGVQSSTFYFRTSSSFNWYKGGTHRDTANDAGGGTRLMRLDSSGNLTIKGKVGLGPDVPKAKLHVTGGNIFIAKPNSLVITSPNGACWFITVGNTGALSTISVTCP